MATAVRVVWRSPYALYDGRSTHNMTAVARVVCRSPYRVLSAEKDVHKHRKNAKFSFARG